MGRNWGNLAEAILDHKFSESLMYHIAVKIAFHFNSFLFRHLVSCENNNKNNQKQK